jgi:hypothetical protein
MAVSFFATHSWKLTNDKLLWLRTQVLPSDKKDFSLDHLESINYMQYYRNIIIAGKKYLLKEDTDTLPQARSHYRR